MKNFENHFIVSGRIGKDAEVRTFSSSSVARFSIALSRKDKTSGNVITAWMDMEIWSSSRNPADEFSLLTKGRAVTCEGRFRADSYQGKDGKTVNKVTMSVDKVIETPERNEQNEVGR